METSRFQSSSTQEKQFKSYYVVWKLVWLRPPYETSPEFKSYYVVWKPIKRASAVPIPMGLNRTMQYGNEGGENMYQLPSQV